MPWMPRVEIANIRSYCSAFERVKSKMIAHAHNRLCFDARDAKHAVRNSNVAQWQVSDTLICTTWAVDPVEQMLSRDVVGVAEDLALGLMWNKNAEERDKTIVY